MFLALQLWKWPLNHFPSRKHTSVIGVRLVEPDSVGVLTILVTGGAVSPGASGVRGKQDRAEL